MTKTDRINAMSIKTPLKGTSQAEATAFRRGVAERLYQSRMLLDGSQAAIARNIGTTPKNWHRYENGEREVDLQCLAVFCLIYDVDPRWILFGDVMALSDRLRRRMLKTFPETYKYLALPAVQRDKPASRRRPAGPPRSLEDSEGLEASPRELRGSEA